MPAWDAGMVAVDYGCCDRTDADARKKRKIKKKEESQEKRGA